MKNLKSFLFLLALSLPSLLLFQRATGQPQDIIYEESEVPPYVLPGILKTPDGRVIANSNEWFRERRHELIRLFEEHVYGRIPGGRISLRTQVLRVDSPALSGMAVRKQIRIFFSAAEEPFMDLLLYLPAKAEKPVPVFLGLNFDGNHTVHPDTGIYITPHWVENDADWGTTNHKANVAARGSAASRWPVERIIQRGYGLATMYYGDIDPDFDDGFQNGVHPLFYKSGKTKPDSGQWGSIAAWAWGLQRSADYLASEPGVDMNRLILIGHSRLGKTALWAGALDTRFAMIVSNNSGCGGAALSKRVFGETVKTINTTFPHWFCDNFQRYNDREELLPVDQHMLIALMAPRPVYIASASEDLWADPKGEFLSALHASSVFELMELKGMETPEMPPLNMPLTNGSIGYHIRSGNHDITPYDWEIYLDFADQHLK